MCLNLASIKAFFEKKKKKKLFLNSGPGVSPFLSSTIACCLAGPFFIYPLGIC